MWGSILGIIRRLLGIAENAQESRQRARAEETGAIRQREVDARAELEDTRGQLDEAVNRRPGDGRRALDRGDF